MDNGGVTVGDDGIRRSRAGAPQDGQILVPPHRGLREAVGVGSMRDIPLTRTALTLEQPPASPWSAAP